MFKMFAIVVNLATSQSQPIIDPAVYPTFEKCTAAMPARYAAAKEAMSKKPLTILFSIGRAYFEPEKQRGA
jgi:hypothetical protein